MSKISVLYRESESRGMVPHNVDCSDLVDLLVAKNYDVIVAPVKVNCHIIPHSLCITYSYNDTTACNIQAVNSMRNKLLRKLESDACIFVDHDLIESILPDLKVLESIASYRDSLREKIDERIRANRKAIREDYVSADTTDFFNGLSARNQEIRDLQILMFQSRINNKIRGEYGSTI